MQNTILTGFWLRILSAVVVIFSAGALRANSEVTNSELTINKRDIGYRGIWYMNQPSGDEYVYKYSGGLGTYCAKHKPFAVYCGKVNKTFFCYGGTTTESNRRLLHMISYYDHRISSWKYRP